MQKKRTGLFLSVFLFLIIALSSAQEISEVQDSSETNSKRNLLDEVSQEYPESTLGVDAGTLPGEILYPIDSFFDGLGKETVVLAEKFAEIKQLLNEGKKEEAKIALENFKHYVEKVQENVSPENRDEIREIIASINRELFSLRGQGHDEFVSEIASRARETLSAIELVNVIEGACERLSELAVSDSLAQSQFENLCIPSTISSEWHKNYYKKLTKSQQEEVKLFVKEVKNCFMNPSECDCSAKTDNREFENKCKLISDYELKCRAGDKEACLISQEIGRDIFETLASAPQLQSTVRAIEKNFEEIEGVIFENHMSQECKEAGITGREKNARKECNLINLKSDSSSGFPNECRDALIGEVENGETNERALRETCEKIMFETNTPLECLKAGIDDFKECGKFMFKKSAPKQCLDAGLIGSSPRDSIKCERIMNSLENNPRRENSETNFNCRTIEDSEKRLACFDGIVSSYENDFSNNENERWPYQCERADARDEKSCEEAMRKWSQKQREDQEFDYQIQQPSNSNSEDLKPSCDTLEECDGLVEQNSKFNPSQQKRSGNYQDSSKSSGDTNSGSSSSSSSSDTSSNTNSGSSSSSGSTSSSGEIPITGSAIISPDNSQDVGSSSSDPSDSKSKTIDSSGEITSTDSSKSSGDTNSGSSSSSGSTSNSDSRESSDNIIYTSYIRITRNIVRGNPFLRYYFR